MQEELEPAWLARIGWSCQEMGGSAARVRTRCPKRPHAERRYAEAEEQIEPNPLPRLHRGNYCKSPGSVTRVSLGPVIHFVILHRRPCTACQRQASSPTAPRHRSSGKRFGDKIRGEGNYTRSYDEQGHCLTSYNKADSIACVAHRMELNDVFREGKAKRDVFAMAISFQAHGLPCLAPSVRPTSACSVAQPTQSCSFGMSSAEISG